MNEAQTSPWLSIITPCLNEAENISECLKAIPKNKNVEIILVDGGSQDGTLERLHQESETRFALQQNCVVVSCEPGRAKQMNKGAALAAAPLLCFLHADSLLPDNAIEQLKYFSEQDDLCWGRFDVRLNSAKWPYRIIESFINKRSALFHVATGDQGIFVKRDTFNALKGFEDLPLMEDVALTKALRCLSPSYRITSPVITSSRRWERYGVIKTVLLMWYLRFAYFVGVSPQRLYKLYYAKPNQ